MYYSLPVIFLEWVCWLVWVQTQLEGKLVYILICLTCYWPQVIVNYICLVYYVLQLPVACKACPCGHNFFSARRAVITAQAAEVRDEGIMKRRRTERVKRGKPNYYDALEYEKQTKKVITFGRLMSRFRDHGKWIYTCSKTFYHDHKCMLWLICSRNLNKINSKWRSVQRVQEM